MSCKKCKEDATCVEEPIYRENDGVNCPFFEQVEKIINARDIIEGKIENRNISLEDAACEAAFQAIRYCNSEYQQAIQQMYRDFISLRRINKVDMKKILNQYADLELGEDINPYLEDIEEENK